MYYSMDISKFAAHVFLGFICLADIWNVKANSTASGTILVSTSATALDSSIIHSCVKPSSSKKTLRKAKSDCEERSGSLLGPNYLIRQRNPSLIGNVDAFVKKHPIWFDDDIDEAPCKVLSSNDSHNATFEDGHYYFCFFNDTDGPCKLQYSTAISSTSPTTASSTNKTTTREQDSSKPITVIIGVYATCVVIVIVGGFVVVKARYCRKKSRDDIFHPSYFGRPRLTHLCGVDHPRMYRSNYPYNRSLRIRNLSDVSEITENNSSASNRHVEDDAVAGKNDPTDNDDTVYEPFDFHANRQQRDSECPPTPGLYTPLLNPGDITGSAIFFGATCDFDNAGEPVQLSMENSIYEPYDVTTRL